MAFIDYKYTNQGAGQLLSGITAFATTAVLKAGQGALFPSTYPYRLTLIKFTSTSDAVTGVQTRTVSNYEVVEVTNRSTDTLTIARGKEASTPFAFSANDYVYLSLTKEQQENINAELVSLRSDMTTANSNISALPTKAGIQNQSYNYVLLTGGTTAYVATPTPAWTSYVAGQKISVKFNSTCTGQVTLNVSSLGAKNTVLTDSATATSSGQFVTGQIADFIYDGTNFQWVSSANTSSLTRAGALNLIGFGSDGNTGTVSGNVTLTGTNYAVNYHFYNNLTVGSGQTLTASTVGAIHVVNVLWDLNLSSGAVNFAGLGSPGGAWASTSGAAGSTGTTGGTSTWANGWGVGGIGNTSVWAAWTYAVYASGYQIESILWGFVFPTRFWPGAGGGGGWVAITGQQAGTGGAGGGCIIFMVKGNVNVTSATATVAGAVGGNKVTGSGGGGGGGGGGYFAIFYVGTLTGSLTPTVSAGAGGTGDLANSGAGGGAGCGANGSAGSNTNGGAGGAGTSAIVKLPIY